MIKLTNSGKSKYDFVVQESSIDNDAATVLQNDVSPTPINLSAFWSPIINLIHLSKPSQLIFLIYTPKTMWTALENHVGRSNPKGNENST